MPQRSKRIRTRIARFLIYLFFMAIFGLTALILFRASAPIQRATGSDETPGVIILTNERQAGVIINVNYYQKYNSTPEGLGFFAPSGALPIGVRQIYLQFVNGVPRHHLSYAILLGRNSSETHPIAQQGQELVNTSPGGSLSTGCTSVQTMATTQVLYGRVELNPQGNGSVDTVGKLQDQHAYLTSGQADIVGVLNLNTPFAAPLRSRLVPSCTFADWPYLAGIRWYSPSNLTGSVNIGPIGSNYTVDSATPALSDLSQLSWQVNGPTSITYTLTDNNVAYRQEAEAFIAGVAVAAGAALAVEAIKSLFDTAEVADSNSGRSRTTGIQRPARRRHPYVTAILSGSFLLAAIRAAIKVRSGRPQQ